MQLKDRLYTIWSRVRHQLTAWNTAGEGIHSPRLFYIVSMLVYDRHAYYAWRKIEQCRRKRLHKRDAERRHVDEIAARLVVDLGHVMKRPLYIAQLGTGDGITTAYMAAAGSQNRVRTYGGESPQIAQARDIWHELGINNITVVEGDVPDTLYNSARAKEQVDLAYIGVTSPEQMWQRYLAVVPSVHTASIVLVEGIHQSRETERVWQQMCDRKEVTSGLDMYQVGMLVFDPHYLKRNYKLRI